MSKCTCKFKEDFKNCMYHQGPGYCSKDLEIHAQSEPIQAKLVQDNVNEPLSKESLDFAIHQVGEMAKDKPEPGWDPGFYHTLSYETDLELWQKAIKSEKQLKALRKRMFN